MQMPGQFPSLSLRAETSWLRARHGSREERARWKARVKAKARREGLVFFRMHLAICSQSKEIFKWNRYAMKAGMNLALCLHCAEICCLEWPNWRMEICSQRELCRDLWWTLLSSFGMQAESLDPWLLTRITESDRRWAMRVVYHTNPNIKDVIDILAIG